nr:unnamed protein product [Digitaria exilis]
MDKEKISNEQPLENGQEEAELDGTSAHQSNGIHKEKVTDSLSHGESITEASSLLKHEKDEEAQGHGQKDLEGVTVDDDSVQENTLKAESAIEQTDDGQQDQNQEPEKANDDTQPASIANNVDVEVVTEAPTGPQTPVEPHLDDSGEVPGSIDEMPEPSEPTKADCVVHLDHNASLPEDTSISEPTEEVVKVEDQQSQQDDMMDADVVQEEMLTCEETDVQEEVPKAEHADELATNAHEALNQESIEETDGPMDEKIEDTVHQSNMEVPEETATRETPVNIEVQSQESLEEIEDAEAVNPEAAIQQRSIAFEEAIPEDQHNLRITVDGATEQEDALESIEKTENVQQDQDVGLEKATENTQPASMANIPDVEVIADAPPAPVDISLDNSDGNTETDESAKADGVSHPDHKEAFSKGTSIAEPTEEVVGVEDQQNQQVDAMDEDVVKKEVLKSEHTDVPITDAHEVLNQESAKETDGSVDEKIKDTVHQSNLAAPEETTTREPPVNIQEQNQESLEQIEDAEAVNPEAAIQQRSVAFEEATPEDQHNLGVTVDGGSMQEDTLEAIEQTEDFQQDQDVGLEKATENTQPESMTTIPDVEVTAEAHFGVQTPVDTNLDNSDGNIETDESAKTDGDSHPDHKEGFSKDTSIAESTEEVVEVEDQQNQHIDAMDEDVVKKEVPKSELVDEPATDTQEFMNQESTEETDGPVNEKIEETDGPVNEKIEETEHKSNMAPPETTPEHDAQPRDPPVNIQMQNQESLEEIEDAEGEMQENSATVDTIPEDHVATAGPCEIQQVHQMESEEINGPGDAKDEEITNNSSTENAVQDKILQSGPTTDIQPVQELGQSESKSAGTYEMDEASDQTHAVVFNGLDQQDVAETSEPQVTETDELKNIEVTEAQEFTTQGYATPSKELSAEDDSTSDEPHNNDFPQTLEKDSVEVKETISTTEDTVKDSVTAEEPTCDSQEVDNAEPAEETKESIAENIVEASECVMVDNAVEEENVLPTEDAVETHMPESEPEETKSTEPVETEESSNQTNAVLFNDSADGDNTPESAIRQAESATETSETETVPQESDACVSEEPDHLKESETNCDSQEVSIIESLEAIDGDKDIITGEISGQNNMVSARESAQENNVPESEPSADIQPLQELEPEAIKNTGLMEVKETSDETNTTVYQTPIEEDNPAIIELHESARELTNSEAVEAGTPHQSSDVQSEEEATDKIESEPQVLEPESVKEMNNTETTAPQNTSQDNIISTSGESIPEEIATEDSIIEPEVDEKELQDQESANFKEIEDDKPQEIASLSTLSTSEQSTSKDKATSTEQNIQAENSEPAEGTEGTEDVKSDTALAEVAAPEENLETYATTDMSVQKPEPQETKDAEPAGTEDVVTSDALPAANMDMETMETEVVPRELTEDGTEPVLELEPVEDTQGTNTTEHPGEPHGSPSDEPTPTEEKPAVIEPAFDTQQVQNLTCKEIKDSEDAETDRFSDLSSFPTPEEADQESKVQKLGSTEKTRDIESMGTKDHQEHGVSNLEDHSEPNVDDEQVHEEKVPEVKDNEAMEAKEVIQESNIDIPDDAAEETSELRSDPDSYVQPAQQVELCKDSENSQLLKAQETSGQVNAVALEETPTEDTVVSEIDPPVDIKQDHEQEPVEEIKGNDENEAEEEFHTSQIDVIEKPASEDNMTSIETTYGINQENELEAAKEINSTEAINDGEQTENATSEDPSPIENETSQEGNPAELNEQTVGIETDNAMLVTGIKDEIQTSLELQDDACDFGETVLTTQDSENVTANDAVQSPGDDILETSNNTDQVKEEQKDRYEHNSSKMSGTQNEDNIINVQDRDISGELLTKIGTEDASQALFESDPLGAQDVTEKDDTIEGGEQTSDLNSQPDDVAFQPHTCEADALSIEKQDEVVQKVDLDQQQKEDEKIESQKEELQTDEQKHEDNGDDFTTESLVEYEGIENDPTYRTEDSNACEAEQTETVSKHEEVPQASEESVPISMDMKVENVKRIDEGTEDSAEAKNDNKEVQESTENDDTVAKDSTDKHDDTTGEITNEELEPDLASSGQEASDPAPSNEDILQSDPASITQTIESAEHREDKECTEKVNDDVHAIQASEEEITDEIKENKEVQNEDNAISYDESRTKPEEEEEAQLHSNEPCSVDAKTDDTTTLGEEIVPGNEIINPREIEEIGESKGLDSTSEPLVESSIQHNVEQDLNSHHKVEGEKISMSEQNAVNIESMQEKADASASDINQTKQCQEEINIDDIPQLEVEENSFGKIDETISYAETSTTDAVTINDNIIDKGNGADGGPSDGSLQTFKNSERDLDVASVITASKEESVNENMEDHKLALPAQGENTLEQAPCLEKTEREMPSSEKLLPTEPEEKQIPNESNEEESQDDNQMPNEKNEEEMQDTEIGDAQKEVEQDLPVSHFLMNLILGKKNSDANENSESEAETKQEETTEDESCVIISKQEESLGSVPTENKVDDNLTFEPENHDVKCTEETQEIDKEESDNVKLDTERSMETDGEFNKNTPDLEIAAYHGNPQVSISGEPLSEEAASVSTKMETRDIEIMNLGLDDRVVDTVCQESTEASTEVENGSLKSSINDLTNTKASGEDTLGEGQIGLLHESLPGDKSADAVSEQTPLSTESGTTDAKHLSCDAENIQNLACAKEDEPSESSVIEATSAPDSQMVCEEVEKKEEQKYASTATGQVSEEGSYDNIQKSKSTEVKTDEQAPQMTEPVSNTEKILAHEEENSEACMEDRENSNISIEGAENFQTAVEIQADGPNMKISQDKKDEIADNKTAMEPETDTEQKSPEVTDGDQQLLVQKETMIKEQAVPGTVETQEQTMSIKSNEEQFDSKVQERDLNMISPREASEAEESFVDVKPEFSTDEEQSPKADAEEIAYDEKTKEVEETKNYTDGAAMKTEAPGATKKAYKKLNLLSGVGSKVKHQLAKVKKAIVGKPGNTKPDSPKS